MIMDQNVVKTQEARYRKHDALVLQGTSHKISRGNFKEGGAIVGCLMKGETVEDAFSAAMPALLG